MQNRRLQAALLRRQVQDQKPQPVAAATQPTRDDKRKHCFCLKCRRMRGEV